MHPCFLVGFHRGFWIKHFDYLQSQDDVAKLPSFIARHICVRYFLIRSDLMEMDVSAVLHANKQFADYVLARKKLQNLTTCFLREDDDVLNPAQDDGDDNEKYAYDYTEDLKKMDIIEGGFMKSCLKSVDKHFVRWATDLLFLSLSTEAPIARVVAKYMLTVVEISKDEGQHDRAVIEPDISEVPFESQEQQGRTMNLKMFLR